MLAGRAPDLPPGRPDRPIRDDVAGFAGWAGEDHLVLRSSTGTRPNPSTCRPLRKARGTVFGSLGALRIATGHAIDSPGRMNSGLGISMSGLPRGGRPGFQ